MPLYEVEWTEIKKHKAQVLVPSDKKALEGAESGELLAWVESDQNPVIANGPTETLVTLVGRVTPEGTVPL